MSRCPGCGSGWHDPGRLTRAVEAAGEWDTAADLDDHVLATLLVWSDGSSKTIRAEAERRREHYLALAAWYADLAGSFDPDGPRWTT